MGGGLVGEGEESLGALGDVGGGGVVADDGGFSRREAVGSAEAGGGRSSRLESRSWFASSVVRPLLSRKETLRSLEALRMSSCLRNWAAWSRREVLDSGSFEGFGDASSFSEISGAFFVDELASRCHCGICFAFWSVMWAGGGELGNLW